MKKLLLITLTLTLLLSMAVFAVAEETKIYGDFEYIVTDGEIAIWEYIGEAENVTIPASIDGCPVTAIDTAAFELCDTVVSVFVPEGVKSIGDFAFNYCEQLTSVTLPNSITYIGENAFSNCTALTEIMLPYGITSISDYAFAESGLVSVVIPEGIENISEGAFEECEALTSVTLPEGLVMIDEHAFDGCTSLAEITIPESVKFIRSYAFRDCKSLARVNISSIEKWCNISIDYTYANPLLYAKELYLNGNPVTELVIPEGVTSIGRCAFKGFSGLTGVRFSDSVTTIGDYAFYDCENLAAVNFPEGITSIGEGAFALCENLASITFSDSLTSIGVSAFEGCSALENICIPDSVTVLNDRTFYQCASLKEIVIPDSVKTIGYMTFGGCESVTSITLGKNVETIGEDAFKGLVSVKSLTIPENVQSIGKGAFNNLKSLTQINWNTNNVADFSENNNVFSGAGQNGDGIYVVFGDNVERIPAYIFCPSRTFIGLEPAIVSVTIGKNVKSIGKGAFQKCENLTSIAMGESVTEIGDYAFKECTALTNIALPEGLTSLGFGVFYDCTSLESITIPENVTEIKGSAFFNCKNLTQINWNAKNVTDFDDDNRVFSKAGQNSDGVDVVFGNKVESIPAYILCPNKTRSDQDPKVVSVTIGENVKSIGAYAFEDCLITSITIPESVETMGIGAFYHCTSLKRINWNAKNVADFDSGSTFANSGQNGGSIEVVFGDTVERIPAYAFGSSLNNILSVIIGKNVKSIGEYAFKDCRHITNITIGESVESIGEYAFDGCNLITSITIPENVTYIGNCAFYGYTELAEVNWNAKNVSDFDSTNYIFGGAGKHGDGVFIVFGENVESIPAYAFCPNRESYGYPLNIASATIGSNVKSIGQDAFYNCKNLVIFCEKDAAAYDYAIANGFEYVTGSYIVMYNANGGDGVPENQLKIRDTDLVLDSYVPSREGYSFEGWATSPGGKAEYEAGATYTHNSSVTLYAAWKANEYVVSYDANGGEGAPESQIKIYGKALYLSDIKPTREGYDFKGWSKTKDGNTIGSQYRDNEDVTLYAVWELTQYNIVYYVYYGIGTPATQKKIHGEDLVLSETVPTRTGYVFMGWSANWNNHVDYQPGDIYKENCAAELLAVWKKEEYRITYNANGGEGAPEEQIKLYSDSVFLSRTKPTREGYWFWGWGTSADATYETYEYLPGDMYTKNESVTLYAVWIINEYCVTYYADGSENIFKAQQKVYGEDLILSSEIPAKDGFVFLGWSATPDATEPDYKAGASYTANEDIDLYAVWTKKVASTRAKFGSSSVSMAVGGDVQLAVTLTPSNSTDTLTWSVDKPDIATVDENGVVTALSTGKAKVTVMTESGKKATCTVTVGMPATNVEFSSLKSTSLAVGKTLTLKAKAVREDGEKPVSTNVVYEIVEGEDFATIDANGKLKGIASGEVVVRAVAEAGTEEAFAEVTINVCVPITKIKLNVTKASMVVGGDDLQLVAIPYPEHHTDTLIWSVDKSDIATVDENGVVTAHAAGKVKVTAMSGSGKKATCLITIGEPATRVEFTSLNNTSFEVGKTLTLKAKASREDKVKPVSTNVVYEIISGEEYATIDTKGKLKGIATGEVVVRAYAEAGTEDAYADVTINVCIPITRISLNKTRATVSLEDGELQLSADITPVENTDTLVWTSANEEIATVDENGLVTVHTKGRVKITVKSGSGKSATCTVTVTE